MKEKDYHGQRRMFFVIEGELVLPEEGSDKSHREWLESKGYAEDEVNRIIDTEARGVLNPNGEIRFYVGNDWNVDPKTEKKFFEILPELVARFGLTPETIIGGGAIKGEIGEAWQARKVYGKVGDFIE